MVISQHTDLGTLKLLSIVYSWDWLALLYVVYVSGDQETECNFPGTHVTETRGIIRPSCINYACCHAIGNNAVTPMHYRAVLIC